MTSCKPISIHIYNDPYRDPTHYHSLVGELQYLKFIGLDLSYSVNFVCQFMHATIMAHYQLVKRILRYVHGTAHFRLQILASSTLDLYGFSDADWAGCSISQRFTTWFCTFLGSNCISWNARKQSTMS